MNTRAEKLIAEAKRRNPCNMADAPSEPADMRDHDLMRALADELVGARGALVEIAHPEDHSQCTHDRDAGIAKAVLFA